MDAKTKRQLLYLLNGIILLVILAHSVYRDIQLENQYACDLRNRIVGARLQKDKKLPYLYRWNRNDDIRYFDPQNVVTKTPEKIGTFTASPFFHQLLEPICDLPQQTIAQLWLVIEYLCLCGTIFFIMLLTKKTEIRWFIIDTGILFTLTEAWKAHVVTGQMYIILAFLMSCVIAGMVVDRKTGTIFAGICAAAFILIRPMGIVLLLPCILFFRQASLFLIMTIPLLTLYVVYVLSNPFMVKLYENYRTAMQRHVDGHQKVFHTGQNGSTKLHLRDQMDYFEGVDLAKIEKLEKENDISVYSETGNVFVLYYQLTGTKIPLWALQVLNLAAIVFLCVLFYWKYRYSVPNNLQMILFGFTLYMVMDVFIPVFRHQYNTVQWFPLVLTCMLLLPERKNIIYLIIAIGLLLNISNIQVLPMRHTIGEYLWLAALLMLIFIPLLKKTSTQPYRFNKSTETGS